MSSNPPGRKACASHLARQLASVLVVVGFSIPCGTSALAALSGLRSPAYGTIILTHGLNGNTDGWVTGMANRLPLYPQFPATNFTCYSMYFFPTGGSFQLKADRVSGVSPSATDSGGIVIKLDWRNLADGSDYNTFHVAAAVVLALLNPDFVPELGGHALAEMPLHLVGHSRGASLLCELSRLLGTNGIWVDHLTSLDAHPLNDDDFPLDGVLYDVVDAPVATYENVLFHDSYWQTLDQFAFGKPVAGSYMRRLTNLDGGYGGLAGAHSDVHLWYHASLDARATANDTEASLDTSSRTKWFATYEKQGTNAGIYYSRFGGGNRRSTDRPLGGTTTAIRDGYNQWWDLGAGTFSNRSRLPTNSGTWPSLIRFNRTATNQVEQGHSSPVSLFYQWARPDTERATISLFLDDDLNPLNTNHALVSQIVVPGTGAGSIGSLTTNLPFNPATASPGRHALFATIAGNGQVRYLYAPELIEILPGRLPPILDLTLLGGEQLRVGVVGAPGQTIVVQASTNLQVWDSLITNTLAGSRWEFTNALSASPALNFFRAVLP